MISRSHLLPAAALAALTLLGAQAVFADSASDDDAPISKGTRTASRASWAPSRSSPAAAAPIYRTAQAPAAPVFDDPGGPAADGSPFVPEPVAPGTPARIYRGGHVPGDDAVCGPGGCAADCGPAGPCDEGYECQRGPIFGLPCGMLHNRLWVRTEYLMWWTQGSNVPPLLTTTPGTNSQVFPGSLDDFNRTTLIGETNLNKGLHSGGRLNFGYWLGCGQNVGIEASYLGLGKQADHFEYASQGDPILVRPFFNVDAGNQFGELIAYPRVAQGSFRVDSTSDFQAAEVLTRYALLPRCSPCGPRSTRADLLLGYRFQRLDDKLVMDETTVFLSETPLTTTLHDEFSTRNQFHGGEIGLVMEGHRGRWSVEGLMKLAVGNTNTRVRIEGSNTTNDPAVFSSGGLFARRTNIGDREHNQLSVVPELGVTVGYDITCRLRATFGYSFIYWSNVARPGDQIDTSLTSLTSPTENPYHPAYNLRTTDFWAQGMNFGLDFRF